ncbi:MAG: hypothetical protein QNJ63_02950 [Calothrix sp. MO_192.B10]|nr:hypothetical protein [Calothrix sp. MO_192.B10]
MKRHSRIYTGILLAAASIISTVSILNQNALAIDDSPGNNLPKPRNPIPTKKADLIPQYLSFTPNHLTDDVSGHRAQRVRINVKNIGNKPIKGTSVRVRIRGISKNAGVYGRVTKGNYYRLGQPIKPGKIGQLSLLLPLNTLKHCQKVSVHIDTARTLQSGPQSVFQNDKKTLVAHSTSGLCKK